MMKKRTYLGSAAFVSYLCASFSAEAVEYECTVQKKFGSEQAYTKEHIDKYKYSVKIKQAGAEATLSRCSFAPSANEVTCDQYRVDKVVFDKNVKIKKFYIFDSQFDVQLFSNLSFLENNGRGSVAYGVCRVVSP